MKKQKIVSGFAKLKNVRISPQKTRIEVNAIKGLQVETAINSLRFRKTKRSAILEKLLLSAVANAKELNSADIDQLVVIGGWVDEGIVMTRFKPRARGAAFPIKKRSSHVTLEVGIN